MSPSHTTEVRTHQSWPQYNGHKKIHLASWPWHYCTPLIHLIITKFHLKAIGNRWRMTLVCRTKSRESILQKTQEEREREREKTAVIHGLTFTFHAKIAAFHKEDARPNTRTRLEKVTSVPFHLLPFIFWNVLFILLQLLINFYY